MRADMAKVIVERPRRGGGVHFPRGTVAVRDDLPVEESWKRQAIRRPWQNTSCTKGLNENLAPLRRYLRSSVGRPWDKVYSEVCQQINRDSAVQLHVWQHLMWDVCVDPHVVTGDVARGAFTFRRYRFYVDPKTGLLRENRNYGYRRPRQSTTAVDHVAIDDRREYRMIDGIWYELELAPFPRHSRVYDMVERRWCNESDAAKLKKLYGGRRVFAAMKRQLNKREIRKLPCAVATRSTS
jgi:hypothetical protein